VTRQGAPRAREMHNVKEFWNKEAEDWGDSPRVTVRDHHQRLLETEIVGRLLEGRSEVLDIGCGSGFGTLFFGEVAESVIGEDYAEEMVKRAQRFLDDPEYFAGIMKEYAPDGAPSLHGNVRFDVGDILSLSHPDGSMDAVVAERVLINLPTEELQWKAVAEVARVLKPGGLLVLTEATRQGHKEMDRFRGMFGLPPIEKYWHNLYVDEEVFMEQLDANRLRLTEVRRFEAYNFLTKVIHPLAVAPLEPEFMSGFNSAARVVCRDHFDYYTVAESGVHRFFSEIFRAELERQDPDKLDRYDRVVQEDLRKLPDFTGCSHHVLFVAERF
jgi:SAM-dependent methyltransferase